MKLSELAELLETGVAMLGASADVNRAPEAFRVWGASITGDGRLRALISSDAGRSLAALRDGAPLAISFTDITSFASVQVKGPVVGAAEPPGPADLWRLQQYTTVFNDALGQVGHPPALGERLRPMAVFAVTMDVEELYDQTPGPGAGANIELALDG
jgi:hypothetical protein